MHDDTTYNGEAILLEGYWVTVVPPLIPLEQRVVDHAVDEEGQEEPEP